MKNEELGICFYNNIIDLLYKSHIKQKDFLKENGLTRPSLQRWKDGGSPSLEAAIKISKYFNVSIEEMISFNTLNEEPVKETDEEKISIKLTRKELGLYMAIRNLVEKNKDVFN